VLFRHDSVGGTRFKVVSVDPLKIKVMQEWASPNDPKGLCGFLGLTGYYKRLVQGNGLIDMLLTQISYSLKLTQTQNVALDLT